MNGCLYMIIYMTSNFHNVNAGDNSYAFILFVYSKNEIILMIFWQCHATDDRNMYVVTDFPPLLWD